MTAAEDQGAPRERTLLAWHRTSLAIIVGSAALARYGADVVGSPVAVVAAVGLVLALVSSTLAILRYLRAGAEREPRAVDVDGRRFAALAASVVSIGIGCVLVVLLAGT